MSNLPEFNFKLSQIYPGTGKYRLNTCLNPDCICFGQQFRPKADRMRVWNEQHPNASDDVLDLVGKHGPGAYKLAGTDKKFRRVSRVFEFKNDPHQWVDQRTIKCQGQTRDGTECKTGFSLLSPEHLEQEVERLRHMNGVLEGPCCGACGVRLLDRPDEFALNGAHERTKDRKGKPVDRNATPKSIRVVHKPCRGKKGARFAVSVPHAGQLDTKDNLRILGMILNSSGINDIIRTVGADSTGKTISAERIYDRIAWLEEVFLAYEREMLRRWREKVETSGAPVEHRLSHDDIVLLVNWETASDRRNTHLNCAVTADADSGFVYRIDVDFDPRAAPLDLFNQTYLDENGEPTNHAQVYPGTPPRLAPKFSWQRPTGRFHEPQFFAACVNELRAFQFRAERKMPDRTKAQQQAVADIMAKTDAMIARITDVADGWFGFPADESKERGSFKGMATRDIYTKAAHFILVKEALPPGKIVLTTEQEATLPVLLPHIFHDEIQADRFAWMAMSFNKKAKKGERLAKVKAYREARDTFRNEGLFDGIFTNTTDDATVTQAFIEKHMKTAVRSGKTNTPFQISNFTITAFPKIWIQSPTQASGELDKVIGFPMMPMDLRTRLKKLPFDGALDADLRADLAPWIYKATLQPVSTFMNSLRERLSAADRASSGGARVGGSYIQGAFFNPKVLIQLLNIFRVHYNFFELRPYASPDDEIDDLIAPPKRVRRNLRIPGTNEIIELPEKKRRVRAKRTPAQRRGIDAGTVAKDGKDMPPDIYRVLYRPWLLMGTKFGARLDRPRKAAPKRNTATSIRNGERTGEAP